VNRERTFSKLVEVFGTWSSADLKDSKAKELERAFNKSLDELAEDKDYAAAYAKVSGAKEQIEGIQKNHPDQASQVVACLRHMDEARKESNSALLRAYSGLVQRWFIDARRWDTPARQMYSDRVEFVVEWRDYFLSYTNRGTPAINNEFRPMIEFVLKGKERGSMDDENCVVKIFVKYLVENGTRGFFDLEKIQPGDVIQDEVRKYCTKTFSMVQFIEDSAVAFATVGKRNWCLTEYELFGEARKTLEQFMGKRPANYFVVTPDVKETEDLFPAVEPEEYKAWFNEAMEVKAIRLPPDAASQRKWRVEFKRLAKAIIEQRNACMERILFVIT
jgi:hypothetical protein